MGKPASQRRYQVKARLNAREVLGCSLSAARSRLIREILFSLLAALGRTACFRCGKEMTSETVSIDHVQPWLHADNARDLYFDVANIDFSHVMCNSLAARRPEEIGHGEGMSGRRNCPCEPCRTKKAEYMKGLQAEDAGSLRPPRRSSALRSGG